MHFLLCRGNRRKLQFHKIVRPSIVPFQIVFAEKRKKDLPSANLSSPQRRRRRSPHVPTNLDTSLIRTPDTDIAIAHRNLSSSSGEKFQSTFSERLLKSQKSERICERKLSEFDATIGKFGSIWIEMRLDVLLWWSDLWVAFTAFHLVLSLRRGWWEERRGSGRMRCWLSWRPRFIHSTSSLIRPPCCFLSSVLVIVIHFLAVPPIRLRLLGKDHSPPLLPSNAKRQFHIPYTQKTH